MYLLCYWSLNQLTQAAVSPQLLAFTRKIFKSDTFKWPQLILTKSKNKHETNKASWNYVRKTHIKMHVQYGAFTQ